jgi:CheY-like chemotaxis protein
LGENIDLRVELCSQPLPVKVDPNQVSQVLLNLALNARDAMPSGGSLSFRTSPVTIDERPFGPWPGASPGRYAGLWIADTGEGLSDEAREHLFEPFFTTKAFGKGTGLGLAMCYGIVKQNRGHIVAESQRGSGTTFTIYLPVVAEKIEHFSPQRLNPPVEVGHETLLFVEDDDLLRNLTVTELARCGYRVIEACNGAEALQAAREHNGPIHLLITDVIMPKMGGVELARLFREDRPAAATLFITGYTNEDLNDGDPWVNVIVKPFSHDALLRQVRQLLDVARTGR